MSPSARGCSVGAFRSVSVRVGTADRDGPPPVRIPDLSGEWEVQEEDKSYKAVLDRHAMVCIPGRVDGS